MSLNTLNQRDKEGYFVLDHRNSPGVSDAAAVASGLPPGAGIGLFEAPTITCSHCNAIVVLNPKRNRERAFCTGCDHYICDGCGARRAANGGLCKTMKQVVEEILNASAKAPEADLKSLILQATS